MRGSELKPERRDGWPGRSCMQRVLSCDRHDAFTMVKAKPGSPAAVSKPNRAGFTPKSGGVLRLTIKGLRPHKSFAEAWHFPNERWSVGAAQLVEPGVPRGTQISLTHEKRR